MDIKKCYQLAERIINHRNKEIGFEITDVEKPAVANYDHRYMKIKMDKDFVENSNKKLVKDIILHEIVHSLGYEGHDKSFREKCEELGCFNKYIQITNNY